MKKTKAKQSLENLGKALTRLQEALAESDMNALIIDATIQRFEFTLELFWKTLKRFLALEGMETNTPKEALKKAYTARWLENEAIWLQMLEDRNSTSHVYEEKKAQEIYQHVRQYFPELQRVYQMLQQKLK
ncbi:MAG: HI0074 family nucleotidyltransferase substrate-binding subunit [Gammaproteobacteria bacterium]|jgi:nucleotidyltransferase substrate binding protein (TIGR01987 family)